MSDYDKELSIAIEIVKKASEITEWFRKSGFEIYKKYDKSTVTMADFASQIYIISKLKELFPRDQIFAEEDELNLVDHKAEEAIEQCFRDLNIDNIIDFKAMLNYRGKPSPRQWNVDPIDGTLGYQKDLSYAIGICLVEKSDQKISVIGVPNYNGNGSAIFSAELYQGAKASYRGSDFNTIHVSTQNDIKKARMCHSLHYDMPWVVQFADKTGITERIQLDSMAKFCMIADGSYDIYIKPIMGFEAYSWDYCAGDLLVREAGGIVTDLDEERLIFENNKCILRAPGILTTNGILHREVADIIRKTFFSIETN
ncbi:MAG: inositol monophosphatase family protein [Candidatus Hodarchaeota archaeon]